jgi:elongation factor G
MAGASLKGKGIQPLLDAIARFLPSPLDRPLIAAKDKKNGQLRTFSPTSKDLCALAFKVSHDEARGPLVYVRVYSGSLGPKLVLRNSTRDVKERVMQTLRVSADSLEPLEELGPGDVGCLVGLKKVSD